MRDARDDAGAAAVEFVALTLVLLLPLVYLVVAVTRVQSGAYAAEAAAYAAARAAVVRGLDALDSGAGTEAALGVARDAAGLAADVTAADFGVDDVAIELGCEGACLAAGSAVTARASVRVPLPGLPSVLRAAIPARVTVEATGASPVDGYVP
ncbi:hypothetical protein [Demequina soli]|uniref:hypothetical protein n=1 Tax=Demequina soli TaxID=1638987 RepID=UPI000782F1E2|nr:hypothetical protein [Demequina soli]